MFVRKKIYDLQNKNEEQRRGGREECSVSTFYFGSTKHRTEHQVLNCSAPSTAPGTDLLKIEHRTPHRLKKFFSQKIDFWTFF